MFGVEGYHTLKLCSHTSLVALIPGGCAIHCDTLLYQVLCTWGEKRDQAFKFWLEQLALPNMCFFKKEFSIKIIINQNIFKSIN